VSRAAQRGEWVLLKNLHFVAAWLPVLEKHFAALPTPHALFHIFLTTEARPAFPTALLARSAMRAFAQPPGIRNNVLHTLAGWGASWTTTPTPPAPTTSRWAAPRSCCSCWRCSTPC
jgi:hypothetical protein